MSNPAQLLVPGHVAHAGVLHGAGQAVAHGVAQVSHAGAHGVRHGVAQGVAHGAAHAGAHGVEHPDSGQAAIALLIEHVAIPTAIAAATVSFLIVIFTSLCLVLRPD